LFAWIARWEIIKHPFCLILFMTTHWTLLPPLVAYAQRAQTESDKPNAATVTWVVSVPEDTPSNSKLFIAGNLPQLGPWQPNAFQLQKHTDGTYRASLDIPIETSVEYKITRGTWATVEKSTEGTEIRNRTLIVRGSQEVKIVVRNWAIPKAKPKSTAKGDLRWREFPSQHLEDQRRITVWLPPQYRSETQMKFPVAYFLDGQNVFDNQRAAFGVEWEADETAGQMATSPTARPVILVAIDNSKNRISEYTFAADSISGRTTGGDGEQFLKFITDELKPRIDQEFRTLRSPDSTALIGSSLGGLFVLHALHKRPDIFGKGVAMSPSLFWARNHTLDLFSSEDTLDHPQVLQRIWLDMGSQEGDTAAGQARAVEQTKALAILIEKNFPRRFLIHTMIDPDAKHHESAWARRLPLALDFLFPEPMKALAK